MSEGAQQQSISRRQLIRRFSGSLGTGGAAMVIFTEQAVAHDPEPGGDSAHHRTEHRDKAYEAARF